MLATTGHWPLAHHLEYFESMVLFYSDCPDSFSSAMIVSQECSEAAAGIELLKRRQVELDFGNEKGQLLPV
ncbi:MAG: hypothetical protein M0R03_05040 [Novosphingobium sp.]|nr:hypothetical protein [Novosphingobium sp.]